MGITPFAIMRKEAYPITYFPSAFISNRRSLGKCSKY